MYKSLSPQEAERYDRDGVLFPLPALSAEEVSQFRAAVESLEAHLGVRQTRVVEAHLHFRWAYELALHPAVLDAVEDILGPDILVHSSSVFCKYPGRAGFISWHQDGFYWGLSAPRLVSAWVALTDSTVENGCMQVVKGTHHSILPHRERRHQDNMLLSGLTVEDAVDEGAGTHVTLKAGEMSLHHVNTVHGSGANLSRTKRLGVAVRYVAPGVSQTLPHHEVLLARGRDVYHNYKILQQPPGGDIAEGVAAQAEFGSRMRRARHIA